jgi:hypothetical protein
MRITAATLERWWKYVGVDLHDRKNRVEQIRIATERVLADESFAIIAEYNAICFLLSLRQEDYNFSAEESVAAVVYFERVVDRLGTEMTNLVPNRDELDPEDEED